MKHSLNLLLLAILASYTNAGDLTKVVGFEVGQTASDFTLTTSSLPHEKIIIKSVEKTYLSRDKLTLIRELDMNVNGKKYKYTYKYERISDNEIHNYTYESNTGERTSGKLEVFNKNVYLDREDDGKDRFTLHVNTALKSGDIHINLAQYNNSNVLIFTGCGRTTPKMLEQNDDHALAKDIIKELRENLSNSSSFEAIYKAVSIENKQAPEYHVIYNKLKDYLIYSMQFRGNPEENMYTIIVPNDFDGRSKLLAYTKEKKGRLSYKFPDSIYDTPLVQLAIASNSFWNCFYNEEEGCGKSNKPTFSMSFKLGLDSDKIKGGVGFGKGGSGLEVSWLEPSELEKALEIRSDPISVIIRYPNNQEVKLDRKTGMLLQDTFLTEKGDRKLVLSSYKAIDENLPYESFIPNFNEINWVDGDSDNMERMLLYVIAEAIGNELLKVEDLGETLQNKVIYMKRASKAHARDVFAKTYKGRANPIRLNGIINDFLRESHTRFISEHPEYKDWKLSKYTQHYINILTEQSAPKLSPSNMKAKETNAKYFHYFVNSLPKNLQAPLREIYSSVHNSITKGTVLGIQKASMLQAIPIIESEESK